MPKFRTLFVLAALLAPAIAAAQAPSFQARWDDPATTLQDAISLAVLPSNVVYVTDWLSNRIGRYTIEGVDLGAWTAQTPIGVAVATDGRVFVGTRSGSHVTVYSATGTQLDDWLLTGSNGPTNAWGLAIGPEGDVYAAAGGEVTRCHSDGQYVTSYKSNHTSHSYTSVAVGADGVVRACESLRCSIHLFAPGVPVPVELAAYGLGGTSCGLMYGLATDGQGRMTVSVPDASTVRHFDTGAWDWEIAQAPGEMGVPRGLGYDHLGHLLVVTSQHYVSRYGMGETPARSTTWGALKTIYR